MVKITGQKAHAARLKRLHSPEMRREVGKAIFAASDMLRVEAQLSISEGAVSGKNHVPSAPGEPPNYDTGHLANRIENRKTGPLKAEVSSNAEYAAPLEFGTSRMAERPYMRPAAQKTRKNAQLLVSAAVTRVTKGGVV